MQTVAIIGAGFSGSLVAYHLLRQPGPRRVTLIERTGRFGPGVAYGTTSPAHLLNVPAGRMSALDDDPDHFLRWAQAHDPAIQGGSFVPRSLFGQYLANLLDHAPTDPARALHRLSADATALTATDGGVTIHTRGGPTLAADAAVLALGNPPPAHPPLADQRFVTSPRYTRDPWAGLPHLDPAAPVLLIGTSLTMMDVVLDLTARGHRGPLHAVSRRGLLSQPHRTLTKPYHRDRPGDLDLWPDTARGMLRRLKHAIAEAARKGVDWREVITSLRADTPRLWQRLGPIEQDRFLRHLRPYWDTHRHRAAPATWAAVEDALNTRRLIIHPARLLAITDAGPHIDVAIQPRGQPEPATLHVAHVINCTGPEASPARVDDPLLQNLLATGLARVDPLRIGLESTHDYRLVSRDGSCPARVRLVGPWQRPLAWEITAVPELRSHARRAAELIVRELDTTSHPHPQPAR